MSDAKFTTTPEILEARAALDAAAEKLVRLCEKRRYELGIYNEEPDYEPLDDRMMTGAIVICEFTDMTDPESDQIIIVERSTGTSSTKAVGMLTIGKVTLTE